MRQHVHRWLPGRPLVWGVDGGLATVSLALAYVTHQGVMVSRLRWDAARDSPARPPAAR